MLPPDMLQRLPHITTLLLLTSIITPTASHALPKQTKTVEYRHLQVRSFPVETPAPTAAVQLDDLFRRQNTVCGYIGGDPDLPATCSAGSHCAVDDGSGAIGCCPDGGPCTAGVFTGCVDKNSPPQTELNPYVYTCGGGDVCYQNQFEGGFFQYGCGSSSNLAATVSLDASGRTSLQITRISLELTAEPTILSEPTTLGTRTTDSSESSETSTRTSRRTTKTDTDTETSTTRARTKTSTSETSTSTSEPTESATGDASAPDKGGGGNNTAAIIGGTVGGVFFLALVILVAAWAIGRRRDNARKGPGQNEDTKYINSMTNNHQFEPLPSAYDVDAAGLPRHMQPVRGGSLDISEDSRDAGYEPYSSRSHNDYNGSVSSGHTGPSAYGGLAPVDHDEIPLTSTYQPTQYDDFQRGFAHSLEGIDEENESTGGGYQNTEYPGPRRGGGGGGALWQQNRREDRRENRNLTWL